LTSPTGGPLHTVAISGGPASCMEHRERRQCGVVVFQCPVERHSTPLHSPSSTRNPHVASLGTTPPRLQYCLPVSTAPVGIFRSDTPQPKRMRVTLGRFMVRICVGRTAFFALPPDETYQHLLT